jgi:hypothetical protein
MSVLERIAELLRSAARRLLGTRLTPAPARIPVRSDAVVRRSA